MSSIKAKFGADVSEVEAKMLQATRATKAYERAVKGLEKVDVKDATGKSLAQMNQQFAKAQSVMKGGAIVGGVSSILNAFSALSQSAKELGSAASENQKAMASWGDSAKKAKSAFSNFLSDAVGSVVQFSRTWGGLRSAEVEAGDAMVKASEDSLAATLKNIEARKRLNAEAKELAKIDAQIADEKKKRGEIGATVDELAIARANDVAAAAEKLAELEGKGNDTAEKRAAIKAAELEFQKALTAAKNADNAAIAKFNESESKAAQERQAEFEKMQNAHQEWVAKQEKDEAALAEARYKHAWDNATLEQKIAQTKKEGQAAYAKAQRTQAAEDIKALGEMRIKYAELNAEKAGGGNGKQMDLAGEGTGRTRNEKGQLMRNGVVISEADAIRTEKTKAENKVIQASDGKKPADILERIEKLLMPKGD
jgi:hypothetical protein